MRLSVAGTETFSSFKEKSHVEKLLKRKYKGVRLTFLDNMIIYQYEQIVPEERTVLNTY